MEGFKDNRFFCKATLMKRNVDILDGFANLKEKHLSSVVLIEEWYEKILFLSLFFVALEQDICPVFFFTFPKDRHNHEHLKNVMKN